MTRATPPAIERGYEYVIDEYEHIDIRRREDIERLIEYIEGFLTGYTSEKRERQIRNLVLQVIERLAERMYYDIYTSIPVRERRFLNRQIFFTFLEELFLTRNWARAIRNTLARTQYSVGTALMMFRTLARHGYEWARIVLHPLELWYRSGIRYIPRSEAPSREAEIEYKAIASWREAFEYCVDLCVSGYIVDLELRGEIITPEIRRRIEEECRAHCLAKVGA